jgi:hypothetical protein
MRTRVAILKAVRVTHLYLGVFIAPALLFFAFTGGLQTFSLHETTRGSDYKPPRWAVVIGQLHKKQTTVVPERRFAPPANGPAAGPGGSKPEGAQSNGQRPKDAARGPVAGGPAPAGAGPGGVPEVRKANLLPMKIFFLVVSVGLLVSTVTGLYMTYSYVRNKKLVTVTLVAGLVVPLVLLLAA